MTDPRPASPRPEASAFERVRLLIEARRPHDALKLAEDGLRQTPGDPDLTAAVAWALLATGNASAARTWAERSLALDPASGWVHHLRALATLNGAGKPKEARDAATRAVQVDPQNETYLYTLVRACLASRDRSGAEQAADAIRHTAPASHLRPLADALIELDRGRVYLRREYSVGGLLAVAFLTRGVGLVVLTIGWLIHVVRRAPHLRRADNLLNEALRLQPGAASVRSVASDVLRLRFRFAQSVDYELATAAIDAGLVDADQLVTSIARRTTVVILAGWASWVLVVAIIDGFVDSHPPVAAMGVVLASGLAVAVLRFDRWQTRSLPKRLTRSVGRRWLQPTAATVVAVFLFIAGSTYLGDEVDHPARGYHLASLVSSPCAAFCAVALTARFVRSRIQAARPKRREVT